MLKLCSIKTRNFGFSISFQISLIILFLCVMIVSSVSAQSEVNYSDQWADDSTDDLQAVGVGITEADYNTNADGYIVQTTLKSPTGQTVSTTSNGDASTRAEIATSWNFNWGGWLTTSFHRGIYTQCYWDDFYRTERCHSYRVLLETTNDDASYTDGNTDVTLLYRKDGPRLRDDYCTYAICVWLDDEECAYGRKAPTRPYPGTDPNSCPAGYQRDFKVVVFRGYRLYCSQQSQEFLSYNPC
jgi:hypothetical protein